jgi:hypothetical protein
MMQIWDFDWLLGALGTILGVVLIVIIVVLLINAIFLGLALGIVGGKNRGIGTTFVTSLLMALIGWIPCLGCILSLYFIKSGHETGWGGAIGAYILTIIIAIVVIFGILFFVFPAGLQILFQLLGLL